MWQSAVQWLWRADFVVWCCEQQPEASWLLVAENMTAGSFRCGLAIGMSQARANMTNNNID